jgi:hypothetical protein
MNWRSIPCCLLLATPLSGCGGNCGPIPFCFDWSHEHSKDEVVEFHRSMSSNGYEPMGYQGSDATHHHFIARPVDWFVHYEVPRAQLNMKDERPLLKYSDSHYRVNPSENLWEPVDEAGKKIR